MSSSRSSKSVSRLLAVLAVLALAVSATTPAAAVSTDTEGVPQKAKVGNEVSSTVTLSDLYTDYEEWTLHGETALTDVTWTVTKFDQAGNKIDQQSYDGQSFDADIALSENVDEVTVKVTGTVPDVENKNYSYAPPQSFELVTLSQTRQGGAAKELASESVHHYTEESLAARKEIQSAEKAISDAKQSDADVSEANSTLQSAISSFENGNFPNAEKLATDAQTQAEKAKKQKQSSEQTTTLLLYGGIGLVVLLLVGGGFYWYSQQGQDHSRL